MTVNFQISLAANFLLILYWLLMEVDDEIVIVIVIILDVVLADGLIGVLGDLEIGKCLGFIAILDVLGRIARILLVNVIGFCFKTQLLLHPG
jgi:hypothetical protein